MPQIHSQQRSALHSPVPRCSSACSASRSSAARPARRDDTGDNGADDVDTRRRMIQVGTGVHGGTVRRASSASGIPRRSGSFQSAWSLLQAMRMIPIRISHRQIPIMIVAPVRSTRPGAARHTPDCPAVRASCHGTGKKSTLLGPYERSVPVRSAVRMLDSDRPSVLYWSYIPQCSAPLVVTAIGGALCTHSFRLAGKADCLCAVTSPRGVCGRRAHPIIQTA